MKKSFIFFLGLFCFPQFVFLQIPAYVFGTGQDITRGLPNGFFVTPMDLLNKNITEADIKTRSQTELEMVRNGKRGYTKYVTLKDEYLGLIFKQECYRFYPSQPFKNDEAFDPNKKYSTWNCFNVKIIGPLCLYMENTYNPIEISIVTGDNKDENENKEYHYSYGIERTRDFALSNGLDGDIYNATIENFIKIISNDEDILNSFKAAYNALKPKPALTTGLSYSEDIFQLFVTYFEEYNNKHYSDSEEK